MATTTIPWNDGSGDNLYLTYTSASGNQTVTVSSDANGGDARFRTVTFVDSNDSSASLAIRQETGLPYTAVSYIETDGTAYIKTGINSANTISADVRVLIPSQTDCFLLGYGPDPGSGQNGSACVLFGFGFVNSAFRAIYCHKYKYGNANNPSIEDSVTNQTPFKCNSKQKKGGQQISIIEDGDNSWRSRSSTQNENFTETGELYLFRTNDSTPKQCPNGTRIYYCKIYSDYDFATLIFDGVPCYYNGEYGLWDKVSDTFLGNAAGAGAFTGSSLQYTMIFHPTSYDSSDCSYYSLSNVENGYANSNSGNYATVSSARGENAESWIYFKFDTSAIPAEAVINEISCTCKCSTNGNDTSLPTRTIQLCSGTTLKGGASNLNSGTAIKDMAVGSWTKAELQDARIKIYMKRSTSNVTSNYYARFYGATLTVKYTI